MVATAMPAGAVIRDGYRYTPNLSQDFTTPAATGAVRSTYSSMAFYNGNKDTSNYGIYDPDRVLSVHDSVLDIHQYIDASGQPLSAAIMPDNYQSRLYGRWDIRYKVVNPADGFKFVGFFWPKSDNWDDGEIDWPESTSLTRRARPAVATTPPLFDQNGKRIFRPGSDFYAPTDQTEYHVASTEWRKDAILFYWDDVLVYELTDSTAIPTKPMRITWQAETWIGEGPVPAGADSHILVDWVVAYGPPEKIADATFRVGGMKLQAGVPNAATFRVGGIRLNGTVASTTASMRIGGMSLSGAVAQSSASLRIGGMTLSGATAQFRNTLRIGGITLHGSLGITLGNVSSRVVDPYDTVSTTVSPVVGSPDAASYSWRQISGPPVTLVGTGGTRSFTAPAGPTGGVSQTVVLGVSATSADGNSSAEVPITVGIRPHTLYELAGGVWSPRPFTTLKA